MTPVRSARVCELSTGVSRITPAPAAAARRTSSTDSRAASVRVESLAATSLAKGHHGVHLDLGALGQGGYPDRHARRRI